MIEEVDEETTPIILPDNMTPIEGPEIDKLIKHALCAKTVHEPWHPSFGTVKSICPSRKGGPFGLISATIIRIWYMGRGAIHWGLFYQLDDITKGKHGQFQMQLTVYAPSKRTFTEGQKILIAYTSGTENLSEAILGIYSPFLQTVSGTIAGVGSKTVTVNYTDPSIGTPVTATVKLTGTTLKKGDNVSFSLSNAVQLRPTDKLLPKITNIVKV
jgi:hypothetical protein